MGSRISRNGSGKSATAVILWDRVPAFLGDGYRLGIHLWSVLVSGRTIFVPVFCSYHLVEVIHAGVKIIAWPTWCFYLLNSVVYRDYKLAILLKSLIIDNLEQDY